MRYSIMLQIVAVMTLVLLGSAALFAWIQNRTEPIDSQQSTGSNSGVAEREYKIGAV